ncbi:MAG: NAD(+)/NADH kinase [Dehalococcoidia bacterium]
MNERVPRGMRHLHFCYHPSVVGAADMTERLRAVAEARGAKTLVTELPRDGAESDLGDRLDDADVLVCVGGDGTVLHASGIASQAGVPVFGVRMGRLGFLAEATEGEAEAALATIMDGGGRVERRVMLQAQVGEAPPQHALNDVVIGRVHLGRTVTVGLRVDGVLLAEYRADAVMAATATGSTGYSLSVGGPILHPTSDSLIVTAVAPHLSYPNALVLPGDARIELEVARGYEAVLLVDGAHEQPVPSGTFVRVTRSPREALFIRLGPERQFYANLARRLGWLRIDHVVANDDAEGVAN